MTSKDQSGGPKLDLTTSMEKQAKQLERFQNKLKEAIEAEQKERAKAIEEEIALDKLRWLSFDKFVEHASKKLDELYDQQKQGIIDLANLRLAMEEELTERQDESNKDREKALDKEKQLLAERNKQESAGGNTDKPNGRLATAIKKSEDSSKGSAGAKENTKESTIKGLAGSGNTKFKSTEEPDRSVEFDDKAAEKDNDRLARELYLNDLRLALELDRIENLSKADEERYSWLFENDAKYANEQIESATKLFEAEKKNIADKYAKEADAAMEANLQNMLNAKALESAFANYAKDGSAASDEDKAIVENKAKVDAEAKRSAILAQIEKEREAEIQRKITQAEAKHGELSTEKRAEIEASVRSDPKFAATFENIAKEIQKSAQQEAKAADKADMNSLLNAKSPEERKEAWDRLTLGEDGKRNYSKVAAGVAEQSLQKGLDALADFAKQLESTATTIGEKTGKVDTRLQGSSNNRKSGSYWNQLVDDMMSVGAVNAVFKQEKFATNIEALVDKGIAFDLKQRAFLMTIQEKIANTFDVADGTLLRLIRIQQQDSTAGRLGMEATLNAFLNNMFETTEYLSDVAAGVRTSLEEMQSLMGGAEAAAVEFQVQKWMGSLYSVGMSRDAVSSIATALGKIAAGDIEGLTGGGAGNLLIMAANRAGESIAEILTGGVDSKQTNKLLEAAVEYLGDLAKTADGNLVVQQQLANVFGVKASDIRAATNLGGSMGAISATNATYDTMLQKLNSMADTMIDRTGIGEMLDNVWKNGQYTLAAALSDSPLGYLTYKLAKLLDDTVGGIPLPFVNVMGFGIDLNTKVSDIMRLGAIAGSVLGSLGPIVDGLSNIKGGSSMLQTMGITSGLTATPRGGGSTGGSAGGGVSMSGVVGNSDGSSVKDAAFADADEVSKAKEVEAKEEEEATAIDNIDMHVVKIYQLLDDVVSGTASIRIRTSGIGLNAGNESASMIGGWGFTDA